MLPVQTHRTRNFALRINNLRHIFPTQVSPLAPILASYESTTYDTHVNTDKPVAELLRMAQRTSSAAREIKVLIEDASTKVEAGARLAQATGETTRQTQAAVRRVHALITEISHAASEQSKGVAQVNAGITELDSITQQNAAMVEELSAAAASLHVQAEVVSQAVRIFKTTG